MIKMPQFLKGRRKYIYLAIFLWPFINFLLSVGQVWALYDFQMMYYGHYELGSQIIMITYTLFEAYYFPIYSLLPFLVNNSHDPNLCVIITTPLIYSLFIFWVFKLKDHLNRNKNNI